MAKTDAVPQEPKWKIGDVVALKSGGPVMTVNYLDGNGVGCQWFKDDNEHIVDAEFHEDMLELYGEEE